MAQIEILKKGRKAPRTVEVTGDRVSIGRSSSCDVTLHDLAISRNHCVIERAEDGAMRVRDLGSSQGVRLGGERVERAPVGDRTVLRVGPYRLTIIAPDWARPSTPVAPAPDADADTEPAPRGASSRSLDTAAGRAVAEAGRLRAAVAARQAEARELREALAARDAELAALRASLDEAEQAAMEAGEDRASLTAIITVLTGDRDAAAARITELESALDTAEQRCEEALGDHASMSEVVRTLTDERDEASDRIRLLERELEEAAAGLEPIELGRLRAAVATLRSEREVLVERAAAAARKVETLQEEAAAVLARTADLEREGGAARHEAMVLDGRDGAAAPHLVERAAEERDADRIESTALRAEVERLVAEVGALGRGRADILERLDEARRGRAAATGQLALARRRLQEARDEIARMRARFEAETRRLVGYVRHLQRESGLEVTEIEMSLDEISRLKAQGIEVIELD